MDTLITTLNATGRQTERQAEAYPKPIEDAAADHTHHSLSRRLRSVLTSSSAIDSFLVLYGFAIVITKPIHNRWFGTVYCAPPCPTPTHTSVSASNTCTEYRPLVTIYEPLLMNH